VHASEIDAFIAGYDRLVRPPTPTASPRDDYTSIIDGNDRQ
jgi:hypothetical protein